MAVPRPMTEDRSIPTRNIHNFRDYGGYSVAQGGRVRRGLLYRSGHHADASSEDLDEVSRLALARVIDLRGNGERDKHACRRPEGFGGQVVYHDGETAGLAPHLEAAQGALDEASARDAMTTLYAALPGRDGLNAVLAKYFEELAGGHGASLVHCAAGKDRTGIAVDLLHHVLGVHPDDAMADYLATNDSAHNDERIASGMKLLGRKYGQVDEATARVLMGVEEGYLLAARRAVKDEYGSTDAYLERRLGVDAPMRDRLRLHLVES